MSAAEYIRITIPALVGTGEDVRLGKVVYTNGVSRPQYRHSAFGETHLDFLANIGVAYTTEDVALDSLGNEVGA